VSDDLADETIEHAARPLTLKPTGRWPKACQLRMAGARMLITIQGEVNVRKSNRRNRVVMRPAVTPLLTVLAVGVAMAPATAQAAPTDSLGASVTFKPGALAVKAPASAVSFGDIELDGGESYDLSGDVGDWRITDARGQRRAWTLTVSATDPIAADNGEAATDAVMTMKVPTAQGKGAAPTVATGDAGGFVRLNTAGGSALVAAAQGQGIGKWNMLESGAGDLKLVMPFDTRAVQYDSTITFTAAQAL
jgi:hypothetical protein